MVCTLSVFSCVVNVIYIGSHHHRHRHYYHYHQFIVFILSTVHIFHEG